MKEFLIEIPNKLEGNFAKQHEIQNNNAKGNTHHKRLVFAFFAEKSSLTILKALIEGTLRISLCEKVMICFNIFQRGFTCNHSGF